MPQRCSVEENREGEDCNGKLDQARIVVHDQVIESYVMSKTTTPFIQDGRIKIHSRSIDKYQENH